ncbi:hypothetical protein HPULCUR_005046 [Helicostylum pulchrum]|uniref:Uncharacterized protein n=1 Tax=Helicostylum pulchrum TaxID=562976 RepID=A0ABP9XZ04_9FUNG
MFPRPQLYYPRIQAYESTIYNAIFFPNCTSLQDDRVVGIAHLHTLLTTVLLEIPVNVYFAAGGPFSTLSRFDLFGICLEVTVSGSNQTIIRDNDQNFPCFFPRNTIIVNSFTIERLIDPVPNTFRLPEILVLSPVNACRSIVSTGLESVNIFDASSTNNSEGSGPLGMGLARDVPQGTSTTAGGSVPAAPPAER